MNYSSLMDGCYALLDEATSIIESTGLRYMVIGGWAPLILNSSEDHPHPGTKDVDILFQDAATPGTLDDVINLFFEKGFIPSAKHAFQLLKKFDIGGKEFMYSVDLLHPSMSKNNPELFVDHLDLEIKLSPTREEEFRMASIVLPSADFLFDEHFEQIYIPKLDRKIQLMTESGCILSKSSSVRNVKRTRDAFDIFLSIHNCRNYDDMINKIGHTTNKTPNFDESLDKLATTYKDGTLTKNIGKHSSVPTKVIDDTFKTFFGSVSIDLK